MKVGFIGLGIMGTPMAATCSRPATAVLHTRRQAAAGAGRSRRRGLRVGGRGGAQGRHRHHHGARHAGRGAVLFGEDGVASGLARARPWST